MVEENSANATSAQTSSQPASASASTTPQATAQSSSVVGSQPGLQQAKPLTAPLINDPTEFLARARERLGYARKDAAPAKASEPAKQASPAKPAESAAPASPPASTEPAKPADPSKPAEPVDDMAARVARLSREQREFERRQRAFAEQQAKDKAEREKASQEHAAKLAQADTVEKAAKAIEAGDVAGAIRMLKVDVNPSAIALQLLEQLQKDDERTMSPAEVERMIAERLKAKEEAREKAEEEAKKAAEEKRKAEATSTLEGARENYMAACLGHFSKEKHPFIAAHGLKREDVVVYAESQRDDLGRMVVPDPGDLLNHFETLYRTRAEAAGWAPKEKQESKPAASPALNPSSLVQDQGGRLVANGPVKTLEQKRAEIRHRLRIGGVQT